MTMPSSVPRRRSSPIKRQLRAHISDTILDATEAVALEVGLGGLTIAEVAGRAGVAVGTLYNYFPDRDAIITTLFKARREAILPLIADAARRADHLPFELRLRAFVDDVMSAFRDHEKFIQIATLADRDGNKADRNTALMTAMIAALEQIMRAGARAKMFPARRAPLLARLFHGSLRALFVWRVHDGGSMSAADGELLVETFLRGVLPLHRPSGVDAGVRRSAARH